MSLEEGRFLNPYSTGLNDVTSLVTSDDHYLVSIGGSNGIVECWDPRARSCIGKYLRIYPGLVIQPYLKDLYKRQKMIMEMFEQFQK